MKIWELSDSPSNLLVMDGLDADQTAKDVPIEDCGSSESTYCGLDDSTFIIHY